MMTDAARAGLSTRTVSFAGSTVRIETCDPQAAALADFLLADAGPCAAQGLAQDAGQGVEAGAAGAPQWVLRLAGAPGATAEPVRLWEGLPGAELQPVGEQSPEEVLGRLCYQLAWWSDGGLVFHAAAASRNGRALLLPGAIGAGKTTLAAWLAAQGCAYMSDELVCVPVGATEEETVCQAFTRPLNLRAGGVAALRAALPGLLPAVLPRGGQPQGANVLLPPGWLGTVRPQPAAPLAAVIFPHFVPGAALDFARLAPAAAGVALMQCLINGRNLAQHGFPAIAQLVRRTPAYRLTYGGFGQLEAWLAEDCQRILGAGGKS